MKKLITILLIYSGNSIAQESIIDRKWPLNKSKVIQGYSITREEGENDKYDVTNICYYDTVYTISKVIKDAEEKMWTPEKKTEKLAGTRRFMKGGKFELYIERLTIEACDTKYVTVIIQDLEGKEIYRETLKSKVASVPSGDRNWRNFGLVMIPEYMPIKFRVFVIDELQSKKYKFLIEKI